MLSQVAVLPLRRAFFILTALRTRICLIRQLNAASLELQLAGVPESARSVSQMPKLLSFALGFCPMISFALNGSAFDRHAHRGSRALDINGFL
jgi:hypothetical protein